MHKPFIGSYSMLPRRKLLIAASLILVSVIVVVACNWIIKKRVAGKTFDDVHAVPYHKAGLLLGTAKYLPGGYLNPYYQYRIAAAVDLLKAGRIKYIIASGDNSRRDYNEPEQMRQDLIAAGVDTSVIFCDYAGFRTFDSIIGAREIFGQNSLVIISQTFHNERAIYIAGREGIEAVGLNAKDVGGRFGMKVMLREKLARVKVFFDYMFHRKPKFLGPKIVIPA